MVKGTEVKLKEPQIEVCETCGCVQNRFPAQFGCDFCKELINVDEELSVSVCGESEDELQFCSWKCLLSKLKEIHGAYYIRLPLLVYDDTLPVGQHPKDFMELIKEEIK